MRDPSVSGGGSLGAEQKGFFSERHFPLNKHAPLEYATMEITGRRTCRSRRSRSPSPLASEPFR